MSVQFYFNLVSTTKSYKFSPFYYKNNFMKVEEVMRVSDCREFSRLYFLAYFLHFFERYLYFDSHNSETGNSEK